MVLNEKISALAAKYTADLVAFCQKAVQTRSYSNQEGDMVTLAGSKMRELGFDEVFIDSTGNVVGRVGNGSRIIHFDSHLDTVEVDDADLWQVPPFSGEIYQGSIWGRGSVDMKSAFCASVFGAAVAKEAGLLEGKTVYVTGTVCEEYCDGENLKMFYEETGIRPDYCIICEPSDNIITLGHTGKAQIRVKTKGVSAHGSAPEKGVNAVYKMAEIITRVEKLNQKLMTKSPRGTIVLSDISCVSASLNAVPSECSIYLDRRINLGDTLDNVRREMDELVEGTGAEWEVGTLRHTTWKGKELIYEPMHAPWKIEENHPLKLAFDTAYQNVFGSPPERYDFWDFGTNAITPVSMGIPTIGFGPGEYKLAHMRDEHCEISKIIDACRFYAAVIEVI
ncbi:MAG TPA: YgeY family selenium metabolism-linked hydrolase [Clostridia bacterium]|nr:YgeY family selenium metabolism-linked hydrolase [Clostridia bacterium]